MYPVSRQPGSVVDVLITRELTFDLLVLQELVYDLRDLGGRCLRVLRSDHAVEHEPHLHNDGGRDGGRSKTEYWI